MAAARVLVLADDLIWSTRLVAAVRAAGAEALTARSTDGLATALATGVRLAIVDLTALAYDGIAAVGAATASGASVLAVGQHDDAGLRKRAIAAGARRFLPYRKMFEDGPATIAAWLATPLPAAPASDRPAEVPTP